MADDNGRDALGRFTEGNDGGPGRPSRATERAYLDATIGAVDLDDWRAIVARAVNDAKAGDDKARAWLTRFILADGTAWERVENIERAARIAAIYPDPLDAFGP